MLLSKNPDMILPEYWPSYFSKTDKTFVWTEDKKIFRYDVLRWPKHSWV